MSQPRSGREPGRADGETRSSGVCILQVDLDGELTDREVPEGRTRAWVEAVRRGHVVAVRELPVVDGVVRGADLVALHKEVVDPGPRDVDRVSAAELPTATVVVATDGARADLLARTVRAILDLDYPRFDVVVVDNRSRAFDRPLDLPSHDRLRVVREPRRGASTARNRGVRESTGELVAFTDDDASVDRDWLRFLGARFVTEPAMEALSGLVLPASLDTEAQLWFEEFYGGFTRSFAPRTWTMERATEEDPLFPYAAGRFGAGCNLAVRRRSFDQVGGFDERLGPGTPAKGGEDLALILSFLLDGRAVGFEPTAVVRHTHRRTKAEFFDQVRAYGVGLTAMHASLVAKDRRHLYEMARRLPRGLALLARPRDERSPSRAPSYPRRTVLLQLLGLSIGPFAYVRSKVSAP